MSDIIRVGSKHLDALRPLLGQYREFYQQASDPEKERDYLERRLDNNQAVIFMARHNGSAVGFVLLYPTFDSVDLTSIWVLHDLFVSAEDRKNGTGRN